MTDLERAFARWQRARESAEAARLALADAVRSAVAQGATQSDVARTLGWPRQRVSKLLSER